MLEKRTPELREHLAGSFNPDEFQAWFRALGFPKDQKEQIQEMIARYEEGLARIIVRINDFRDRSAEMSDAEFDDEYLHIEGEVDRFISQSDFTNISIQKQIQERKELRENPLKRYQFSEFVPIREIGSRHEFKEKMAMYWEPRKEDICRLVFIAKELHEQRINRGEISLDEPISIIDVGGATGAVGALCLDVAKENGLKIQYTVVDPHQEITDPARSVYGDEIIFETKTVREYLLSVLRKQSDDETIRKIEDIDSYVQLTEKKYQDFLLFEKSIEKVSDKSVIFKKIQDDVYHILRNDFSIEPTYDKEPTTLWELSSIVEKARKIWLENERQKIMDMRAELERELAKHPATSDLVINSWMPGGIDFTPDIRMLRGAGIFYISSGVGDTGIQDPDFTALGVRCNYSSLRDNFKDPKPGYEYSYDPGESYQFSSGWLGPSTRNEVSYYTVPRHRHQERVFQSRQLPFLNQFILQTAKDYSPPSVKAIDEHDGIIRNGDFSWEKDMNAVDRYVPESYELSPSERNFRAIRAELQLYAEALGRKMGEIYD